MTEAIIAFKPFDATLSRKGFDCGNEALNRWFRDQAGQQERRNNVRTHLGLATFDSRIASFFSLVAHEVQLEGGELSAFLAGRRYPVPALLIAQLAVDVRYQGRGVGRATLAHALVLLAGTATTVGFEAVVVDAIDEAAASLYAGFGFEPLLEGGVRMFLTTRDLLKNIAARAG